jgi:transmembrane sensor
MRSKTVSGENPEQINAEAAIWLARRDAPDWSDLDAAQLERWMQASFRHRVAYLRLDSVWKKTGRLKALGAGCPSGEIPPPGQWHRSPFADALMTSTRPCRQAMEAAVAAETGGSRRATAHAGGWRLVGNLNVRDVVRRTPRVQISDASRRSRNGRNQLMDRA